MVVSCQAPSLAQELPLTDYMLYSKNFSYIFHFPCKVVIIVLILKEISPEYSLEGLMLKLKLQYFGHLMWRTDSFEKTLMLGMTEGRRGNRGWHPRPNGHEFEQAPGVGDGQESLECCSPWGHKELDTTKQQLFQLYPTLCDPVDCQAPLSIGLSRQEYWSGLPCIPSGDLPNPGIEPASLGKPIIPICMKKSRLRDIKQFTWDLTVNKFQTHLVNLTTELAHLPKRPVTF